MARGVRYSLRLRKAAKWIVGFVQISRSWKDFAVRNGKFVLTMNSIKTSRMRVKTCLILLGNDSVRSRNHAMSVTPDLGAVGIIWPASKPVHILYLKPLHSRVRSQRSLIELRNERLKRLLSFADDRYNCYSLRIYGKSCRLSRTSKTRSCSCIFTWTFFVYSTLPDSTFPVRRLENTNCTSENTIMHVGFDLY